MRYLFSVSLILLVLAASANASSFEVKKDSQSDAGKIILYANNTLFKINADGSGREKLLEKADILDFRALPDGRLLVHSAQYEGESLEIYDPESKIWALVEFTEGDIPNIAISDNGETIAYEIRHFPIAISGDGIWLFDTTGKKMHAKISNTALTIESITLHDGRLWILYHELDLVSDEIGLFIEKISIDSSSKPFRTKVPEGLKMFVADKWSMGFTYPTSGKRLEIQHLTEGITASIECPPGDIILFPNSYLPGDKPVFIFGRKSLDFVGERFQEFLLWDINKGKITPVKLKGLADFGNFNWSPDGLLYFTARYIDASDEKSSLMLFRMNIIDNETELISVNGGHFCFMK